MIDVFPNATPEKLARIRRERPLAGLGRGWATGVTEAQACPPPLPSDQVWGCLGPVDATGVRWACTVTAPSDFAARAAAAVELQCEPGHVEVQPE